MVSQFALHADLVDVKPVEDVDGPEMLGDVVPLELLYAFRQALRLHQLFEVGVVESLLRPEGDLPLNLLDVDEPELVVVQLCQVVGPPVGGHHHDGHAHRQVAGAEEAAVCRPRRSHPRVLRGKKSMKL